MDTFRWRQRGGQLWLPVDMSTQHLWFTLRVLWNHAVPKDRRLIPFRAYEFGPSYTAEYLDTAWLVLGKEILSRQAMLPAWQKEFEQLRPYLGSELRRQIAHPRDLWDACGDGFDSDREEQ